MTLELANLVLAAYMTGVIWIVQVVHYPLFAAVGAEGWPAYEAAHRRRITPVVGPAILAQIVVGTLLVLDRPGFETGVNLGLVSGLLLATAAVFGPLHMRMERVWDRGLHRRLVRLNGVRAVAWTAQAAVAVAIAAM